MLNHRGTNLYRRPSAVCSSGRSMPRSIARAAPHSSTSIGGSMLPTNTASTNLRVESPPPEKTGPPTTCDSLLARRQHQGLSPHLHPRRVCSSTDTRTEPSVGGALQLGGNQLPSHRRQPTGRHLPGGRKPHMYRVSTTNTRCAVAIGGRTSPTPGADMRRRP